MKNTIFDLFIEIILFLYILTLYLFTYRENLNLVSNALALILIFSIWFQKLVLKKRIIINIFSIMYIIFILICLVSVFYAINSDTALLKFRTLISVFILVFSLLNYIDTFKKLRNLMKYFIFSGLCASIYILLMADFTQLMRFGSELGNENSIGVIIGISATFCFYLISEEKKYWFIPILLIMFVVILLTGSRQALLFILLNIIIILYLRSKNKRITNKISFFILSIFIVIICFYTVLNVPILYQIIGIRLENILNFVIGEGSNERSLNTRAFMLQFGIQLFKERPLFGYGIDNYRHLLGQLLIGNETYAHNNFIELLVGVGLIGASLFYYIILFTIKKLFILSRKYNQFTFGNPILALLISYTVLTISSVYYYNKHFNIILGIGSIIGMIYQNEKKLRNI